MAVESLSIPSVTDVICEHLDDYEELRLHGICKAVYHGNIVRRRWHLGFHERLYALYGRDRPKSEQRVEENASEPWLRFSEEAIAVHNSRMGDDDRKWLHMPGETVEEKWDYYIHRKPPHNPWNDPIFSENWAASSRDRGNPEGSMR